MRQLTALVPGLARAGWSGPVLVGRVAPGEEDGSADLGAAGVRIERVPGLQRAIEPTADSRALRALLAVIRRARPDLVHTHTGKAGALGRLAARLAGVPVVHTYHGHHFEAGRWKGTAARWAERTLGRWTDAGIVLSERQRADLVTRFRVLPSNRVHVIEPGLDLASMRAAAGGSKRAEGRVEILWAGRFVPVKDPWLLLEAVARMHSKARVTMLGTGPLLEPVRRAVAARGLEARVRCPGAVASIAPTLRRSHVLVLSSQSEGTSLAALEAMALGTPVVSTAVGGMPDVIESERTGLLVPPGDASALAAALDRLAGDHALRARLGAAAEAEASGRFGAERLVRETAALYGHVAGTGPRQAPGSAGPAVRSRPWLRSARPSIR